ncbi:MAG: hypothetical protein AAGF11_43630 [Myxococcota bacterium]
MPERSAKRAAKPKEVLRLTLDVAATPERVGQVAALFHDTLSQIEPDLREGDVTMVVGNYVASAEVRGWQGGGALAVRLTADLVDNATDAVQKDECLAAAARTLARHADGLAPYRPKFWRGEKELRAVDDVFVRTMRAAGQPKTSSSSGNLSGETITYSPILRIGRVSEGGRVQARIRLEGRPLEVDIVPNLEEHLWDAAKTGDVLPLPVQGEWIESKTGDLRLDKAEIIGVDTTYEPWSGRELLDDVKQHAALFAADDFDRMLVDLQLGVED